MSRIINLTTAVPRFKHQQSVIAQFMGEVCDHNESEANFARKLKLLYERSGITTRFSVLPDFSCDKENRVFFTGNEEKSVWPDVSQRMEKYQSAALELAINCLTDSFTNGFDIHQVTHLITVSCTGMLAPGLDIDIIQHFLSLIHISEPTRPY